ncbi:MAG TPA: type II secretion system F family protein [Streptosporangiaceae bacterium]|nr:type II secretion system F family protein [Streptosporangiaceae bacterium]
MTLLAALAGATVAAGIVLLVRELLRREPPPGVPPRRLRPATLPAGTSRRILLAVGACLAVLAITRWPVAALGAGAAVLFLPRLSFFGGHRHRTAVLEGLEQWIRRLADMLTASRGLEEALEMSARSAPAAIRAPVTALVSRLSVRTGPEAALRAFAADIDDPAGDRIAAALIIAMGRRGGGARDVLNALAVLLARDVAARREIEAERAQHRTTVKWITVFVAAFTVFAVLNRAYSAPYATFAGQVVLALVLVVYAAGLAWLHRLGSSPAPGRFLNGQPEDAAMSLRTQP